MFNIKNVNPRFISGSCRASLPCKIQHFPVNFLVTKGSISRKFLQIFGRITQKSTETVLLRKIFSSGNWKEKLFWQALSLKNIPWIGLHNFIPWWIEEEWVGVDCIATLVCFLCYAVVFPVRARLPVFCEMEFCEVSRLLKQQISCKKMLQSYWECR